MSDTTATADRSGSDSFRERLARVHLSSFETPPWVEYSLTAKGSDLRRAIAGIDRWAERWASQQ